MVMRGETPIIPKPRLDLLYANMGAEALAKYLETTKVATRRWKLGTDNQRTQTGVTLGGAHSTSPRMNDTTAPAGRRDEVEEENGGE